MQDEVFSIPLRDGVSFNTEGKMRQISPFQGREVNSCDPGVKKWNVVQ